MYLLPRSTAARLVALLLVSLMLRLAAAGWWQSRLGEARFEFGDSHSYWVLGKTISRGETYQYHGPDRRVFRTPGYPILLAGLFRLVGEDRQAVWWARVQAALLGTLAVGGVYWLARLSFDEATAMLAAAVTACYPGAIAVSVFVLSEAPFCPLMLAHLALWVMAWQAEGARRALFLALLAGLAAGLATLMRPSWLFFAPLAGTVGLLAAGNGRGRRLMISGAMLLGLISTMLPWWIRNAQVTGRFVPTTLQVGASLYDGLNPDADGGSDMAFVGGFVEREQAEPTGDAGDTFEYRVDWRMRDAALAWARDNPTQAVRLAWVKAARLWNVWPNEPAFSSWPMRLAVAVTFLPIVVLAIYGTMRRFHVGWPVVFCWLPAVYLTLLHTVFVSSLRYREPAMLPLAVLAAGTVMAHYRRRTKARRRLVQL